MPPLTKIFSSHGLEITESFYQLSPNILEKHIIQSKEGIRTSLGSIAISTGVFTGRSPQDRFIVKDKLTEKNVNWGEINQPFDGKDFDNLLNEMNSFIYNKKVYVRDGLACADKRVQMPIRFVTETAYSNLFVYNMFLRPSVEELTHFSPDWLVLCLPNFKAIPSHHHTRQKNFTLLNFTKKIVLIGGSAYTGEIKKSIFSALNFILPTQKNILPMHCSSNIGTDNKTALFFGLSGTGKTTLSADKNRQLIGDDEHGWTPDNKVFNFEGGCYAKVLKLSSANEPEIFGAIKEGALLENVVTGQDGEVDFYDASITQNTRVSYPIDYIPNIKVPSIGENVSNIFFLTADAFGVLPPISKLTPGQAAYHFISGYTAKVAGTEAGINEPLPSFSACFGAPFMPLHPVRYAHMLSEKMQENNVNVWLINTGWTGGRYGIGKRIALKYTRSMINAALSGTLGELDNYEKYHTHSVFRVAQPRECPGVPTAVLSPRQTWNDDKNYYIQAYQLAKAFRENFKQFEDKASPDILAGAPHLKE